MQLLHELERLLAAEDSLFRKQLLREDIARLRKLQDLANSSADRESFMKSGARLGWTQGDARTGEIREPLEALLQAVYEGNEVRLTEAWNELSRARLERLVGCLSTPVPKPAE